MKRYKIIAWLLSPAPVDVEGKVFADHLAQVWAVRTLVSLAAAGPQEGR